MRVSHCGERPMIIVGGELTEDCGRRSMAPPAEYNASLQMKANGGVLVVDDLGRQRFLPQTVFDRGSCRSNRGRTICPPAWMRDFGKCQCERNHRILDQSEGPTDLADDAVCCGDWATRSSLDR